MKYLTFLKISVGIVLHVVSLHVVFMDNAIADTGRIVEIARGHSWVSPYWGYNAPKVVFDGEAYYTAGLWGATPDSAEGVLYKYSGTSWREGAHLSGIYQPAAMVLDEEGRLIVAYTEQSAPVRIYRSSTPGNIDSLVQLAGPSDMTNAYYIGLAIRGNVLYLAYIVSPDYSMYLTSLDLVSLAWTPRRLVCTGQVDEKPKTAWTYPILYPTDKGVHLVASNSPDGGEGNTYNQVWHLYFKDNAIELQTREKIAETPMGHNAFAVDFAVDATGLFHVLFMWNQYVYGKSLPQNSPPTGLYHGWYDVLTSSWKICQLGSVSIAGFCESENGLQVITAQNTAYLWKGCKRDWETMEEPWDSTQVNGFPGFLDVISRAGGSSLSKGAVIVFDSLLLSEQNQQQVRVLWSVLTD